MFDVVEDIRYFVPFVTASSLTPACRKDGIVKIMKQVQ